MAEVEAFRLVGRLVVEGGKKAEKEISNFGEKAKKVGESMKKIGGSMTSKVTAPIIGGFALAVKSTEEFRGDLARLETNANNTGYGVDFINEKLDRMNEIVPDNHANVEGLSNLMRTDLSEEGMSQAIDALSGAVIAFPDTLKFEGLADGLQETLATKKAVGPFAEMLERTGVNLDDFNEGFAEAIEKGDEENYILQTLADTGLASVNEEYRETNGAMIENRDASQQFQRAISELAELVLPIFTAITDKITEAVNWFNELNEKQKRLILIFLGVAAAIGPLMVGIGSLIGIILNVIKVVQAWRKFQILLNFTLLANPIVLIIAGIVALIAIVVLLVWNWDKVKVKLLEIWGRIKDAWKKLKDDFARVMDLIVSKIKEGVQKIKDKFNELKTNLSNKANEIKTNIKNKFDEIKKAISQPFIDAWNKVKPWIDKLKNAFNFKWKIPKPKIPKVSVRMKENRFGIPYPSFSVSWHKKGGWFDGAQLFGAGEAGREVLIPTENRRYMQPFARAISENLAQMKGDGGMAEALTITVPLYLNGREFARAITPNIDTELQRNRTLRKRGI